LQAQIGVLSPKTNLHQMTSKSWRQKVVKNNQPIGNGDLGAAALGVTLKLSAVMEGLLVLKFGL
jgi:hypothetical protein